MSTNPIRQAAATGDNALQAIRDALAQIRYGSITLTVHDARIVQLDITEKHRFRA